MGDITIDQAWGSLGNAPNSAAYMILQTTGRCPDQRLDAGRAHQHTHVMEGGVAKMRPVAAIEVAQAGRPC